ncbi:hypothetical protein C8R45DRAFT_932222 [Mycena sanguinolenta]|nr:hypothetical protein C8R45DRAFT_932222 [Mycena sanguinolenta]
MCTEINNAPFFATVIRLKDVSPLRKITTISNLWQAAAGNMDHELDRSMSPTEEWLYMTENIRSYARKYAMLGQPHHLHAAGPWHQERGHSQVIAVSLEWRCKGGWIFRKGSRENRMKQQGAVPECNGCRLSWCTYLSPSASTAGSSHEERREPYGANWVAVLDVACWVSRRFLKQRYVLEHRRRSSVRDSSKSIIGAGASLSRN